MTKSFTRSSTATKLVNDNVLVGTLLIILYEEAVGDNYTESTWTLHCTICTFLYLNIFWLWCSNL